MLRTRYPVIASPSFCAEAAALFSQMAIRPPARDQAAIDRFIKAAKADGTWLKLDMFFCGYSHDGQAALLDWVNPRNGGNKLAGLNSTPNPSPYTGFQDTGAGTAGWITTTTKMDGLTNFGLNSGHIGGFWLSGSRSDTAAFGVANTSARIHITPCRATTAVARGSLNDATNNDTGTGLSSVVGDRVMNRTASNAEALFVDNEKSTFSTAATSIPSAQLRFLFGVNGGSASPTQRIAIGHCGGALTDADVASLRANKVNLLNALGAGVS